MNYLYGTKWRCTRQISARNIENSLILQESRRKCEQSFTTWMTDILTSNKMNTILNMIVKDDDT